VLDIGKLRNDFPILKTQVHGKPLIYLDNAATLQMPSVVMETLESHYLMQNSNVHRGGHLLSEMSTAAYEKAREKVAKFICVKDSQQIVFTSGTTAAINMVAYMLAEFGLQSEDEILITEMEHHANILIWQHISKVTGCTLKYINIEKNGCLDMDSLQKSVNINTKIVALTQLSNVTGIENPIKEIISYIREYSNAVILIDGAQGIVHCDTDMEQLDCDFYCFSGHKLGGPTGIGVLYMKENWLRQLKPVFFGGGTVYEVSLESKKLYDTVERFEPGTPNYAGAIGLGAAIDYWEAVSKSDLVIYEQALMVYLEEKLKAVGQVQILGKAAERKGALAFEIAGISAYDFCRFLDLFGIAARSGYHCAQPYINALGFNKVTRISPAIYNTRQEIDKLVEAMVEIIKVFERNSNNDDAGSRRGHFTRFKRTSRFD